MIDRTKYIPSIVSLLGGLVACIVTFVNKYESLETLIIILATLIVFYIIGTVIRYVVKKVLVVDIPEDMAGEDSATTGEDKDDNNVENTNAQQDESINEGENDTGKEF